MAELQYATVMVTDYDCWHEDHDHVTVADVVRVLLENADRARALVRAVAGRVGGVCPQGCDRALDHAVITGVEARDAGAVGRLGAVAGRVL